MIRLALAAAAVVAAVIALIVWAASSIEECPAGTHEVTTSYIPMTVTTGKVTTTNIIPITECQKG